MAHSVVVVVVVTGKMTTFDPHPEAGEGIEGVKTMIRIILSISLLIVILLLAACSGQTNSTTTTQSWSQSGYASCTGALCRATVNQSMPQAPQANDSANNVLLAAALIGVASVLLVALALGGAF